MFFFEILRQFLECKKVKSVCSACLLVIYFGVLMKYGIKRISGGDVEGVSVSLSDTEDMQKPEFNFTYELWSKAMKPLPLFDNSFCQFI